MKEPDPPSPKKYITVREIATDLEVSMMTVYRMIKKKIMPGIQVNERLYKVPRADYEAWKKEKGLL